MNLQAACFFRLWRIECRVTGSYSAYHVYKTFLNIDLTMWRMLILHSKKFNVWRYHELGWRIGSDHRKWTRGYLCPSPRKFWIFFIPK